MFQVLHHQKSRRKSKIKDKILSFILPNNIKRIIVISSLLGHIKEDVDIDKDLLEKINNLLILSRQKEALELPMLWHNKIWKDLKIDNNLEIDKNEQIPNLCSKILKLIPPWLRYDNNRRMKNDLVFLFLNISEFTSKK